VIPCSESTHMQRITTDLCGLLQAEIMEQSLSLSLSHTHTHKHKQKEIHTKLQNKLIKCGKKLEFLGWGLWNKLDVSFRRCHWL